VSDLEIPQAAITAALAENVVGLNPSEAERIRLEAAGSIIVAAEFRKLADELYDRADELNPPAVDL
jgi:hypothetical protein